MKLPAVLDQVASEQPWPLLFLTVSGAHLYGFPSPDSDWDLRGVHVLPPREVLGLKLGPATLESSFVREGAEVDMVSHDARKFFELLLKKNGYVLEQLLSPLIVRTTPEHEELRAIARTCVTRHHSHHYLGFAATQWGLFSKERPPRVKPLLYVYRVLLTGLHLMRTGQVEADLTRLNADARLPLVDDLVARKRSGHEAEPLDVDSLDHHRRAYESLVARLEAAAAASRLPDAPSGGPALHALLLRLRLGGQSEEVR